ncbi:MAG: hypothetical protein GPJ54_10610 [Candidatus Heimdallarchaeota archaeon]|nr:hypothetical protein [Candidatus Heimdallarchaeota archaeon]
MSDGSLKDKLKQKLQAGEISQEEYDYFLQKFRSLGIFSDDQTKDSGKRENLQVTGVKMIKGGYFGDILTRGRLEIEGDTECDKLSVHGSLEIEGSLSVINSSSISGSIKIEGDTKFGGPISSTGSIKIEGDLLATSKLSSSGAINVDGDIKTNSALVFNGKLNCTNIQSSSILKLSGVIGVDGNIIAETISISNGTIQVGGDIRGKTIMISGKFGDVEFDFLKEFEDVKDIPDLVKATTTFAKDIVPNIGNLVSTIFGSVTSPDSEQVNVFGNIEADNVVISNTIVHGSITADEIVLGRNLKVHGKVKYRKSINKEQYEGIEIQRIS